MSNNELRMKMKNGTLTFETDYKSYELCEKMKSVLLTVLIDNKLEGEKKLIITNEHKKPLFMIMDMRED